MTEGQRFDRPDLKTRVSRFLEKVGVKESPQKRKDRLTKGIPISEVPRHLLDQAPAPVRIRLQPSQPEPSASELQNVSTERNAGASRIFIMSIRDETRIVSRESCTANPGTVDLIDDRGLRVDTPLERGFFHAWEILNAAERRYYLPMAMYITGNHARLLLKGPSRSDRQREIQVYDPMKNGVISQTLDHSPDLDLTVIHANFLASAAVRSGEYDILSLLEDPRLQQYRRALFDAKLAILQQAGDYSNCIPFCLLANALFYGLQPGDTAFKNVGIPRFKEDFSITHAGIPMGVRILKREEILPPEKPTSRVKVK